jgi:hypothetical protein
MALQPPRGLVPATLRAVPVATGVIPIHLSLAGGALRELAAAGRRPARDEIAQSARLTREQTTAQCRAQSGRVAADDVRHFEHGASSRSAEAVDEVRERISEGGANLLRQVRVDLGGAGTAMPERLLDDAQIHTRFK